MGTPCITEGKYWNQLEEIRKFRVVLSSGVRLATLSFNTHKLAHTLLGRSCILCFETVLRMNKITPTPLHPLPSQKILKFPKTFFCL